MDEKNVHANEEKKGNVAPMSKKGRYAVTAIGCILFALLFFFAGWYGRWFALGGNARSLLWAIKTAERNYYGEFDEDAFYEELFGAFALDPYSGYYTREEYAAILSSNEGNGADTGLSLSRVETNGHIRIFRVAGNSPAEHAGLRDGMYIYRFGADGAHLQTGDNNDLVDLVRAHGDSFTLECGFTEDGADKQLYTLSSDTYYVAACLYRDSETAVRFLRDGSMFAAPAGALAGLPADTAYIRIDEFFGTAADEIAACLAHMKERGRKNLILDLRCNGGGYLSVFQQIASYLMRDAEGSRPVVATAKYKSGKVDTYRSYGNYFDDYFERDSKVYLLADENTASASECLIGALVDYNTVAYSDIFLRKADGVAKTYGKGIMQSHYTDAQGNVLKLTSAGVFWPKGRTIHGVGVTESDGAIGIESTLLPSAEDEFLTQMIERIKA